MSLRYALLAILRVGPMSGYDLKKRFSGSVGHVWHAPDSQIYPELKRMSEAGLIESEDQTRGQKGTRKVHHITPAGDEAFREWVGSPMDYQRVRDPASLHSSYLEATSFEAAREFFAAHLAHWEAEREQWAEELSRLRSGTSPAFNRRMEVLPDPDAEAALEFKLFSYEGLVERAQTEIDWAHRGLTLVDRLASR